MEKMAGAPKNRAHFEPIKILRKRKKTEAQTFFRR